MTGSASASALAMSGGSASGGRSSTTRETRSRMSLVAASMLRSALNSTVMSERSSRELDSIFSMPSRPAIRSSISCVIFSSTMLAPAPR